MPSPTVGIDLGISGKGQGAVHFPTVGHVCRPIGRRADERVVKTHAGAELDHPGGFSRPQRIHSDTQIRCGTREHHRITDRIRRCEQRQLTSVRGQRLNSADEALFHLPDRWSRADDPEATGALRGRDVARHFQQRQRIAATLGDEPVTDPLVEPPHNHRVQQVPGIAVRKPFEPQLGQAG